MQHHRLSKKPFLVVKTYKIVQVSSYIEYLIYTVLTDSLVPKSVTNAIAIELSAQVGGIPSLTIMSVLITGISGVILAPVLIRIAKIQNPVAQGIAFGTSTHLIGTAKALEYGELQGAMSSIAVFITGVITVIVAAFLS